MGFYIFINKTLMMCTETGKPYFFNKEYEKIYEIPTLEIPQEFCEYLQMKGSHLHFYTQRFERKDISETDVKSFLEKFPSWKRFMESEYYDEDDEYWTHKHHKNFKNLLKLLADQDVSYTISWN